MTIAKQHDDQQERISTLQSYDILDTPPEEEFEDIVALAAQICDVPVSLISLVDNDRQWFKARVGFEPAETPLDQSVCAHAILQEGFFEIEDMAQDPRTKDNPLHVSGPEVQFYAGANLVSPNGMPIGTLCVLDHTPRKLSAFQRKALTTLSQQIVTQLELRKRLREEAAMRNEIDHRVKNSLQTIASIMRMASRRVSDPQALDVLGLVERRLDAVASLHSELMGQSGEGTVETVGYLTRVTNLLQEAAPDTVNITLEAHNETIDARTASALGMIISEFVANSIKHAFPDGQDGSIAISLVRSQIGHWLLTCADDGAGHDTSDTPPRDTGLGEQIMSSAATQLDGQLSYESRARGTALTVTFPA